MPVLAILDALFHSLYSSFSGIIGRTFPNIQRYAPWEKTIPASTSTRRVDRVRTVVKIFLTQCGTAFSTTALDEAFYDVCCEEAIRQGYPVTSTLDLGTTLGPFIQGGVIMATTAYSHLPSQSTRVFIAIYTAFLIYLDDTFQRDIERVSRFNQRFILNEPQEDEMLDAFAKHLRSVPQHFDVMVSNIIVTSTLNLVTALLLEHETLKMTLSSSARKYPTFSRVMSGASEAYALFAFPRDIPWHQYIQALPEMMVFINNGNDILSYYKEDMAGDIASRIPTLARCRGVSKIDVLRQLANDALASSSNTAAILAPHKDALNVYVKFRDGYIGFHSSLERYRLKELLS